MATNFPASVDSLTNPTAGDGLNSPSHSAQHANANDAIEAIEGYLLTGAGTNQLVKIIPTSATNGTVGSDGTVSITSTVTSVTVSGAFSSTYDDYKILFTGLTNTNNELKMSLGGITTGYYSSRSYQASNDAATITSNSSNAVSWNLGQTGNPLIRYEIDLFGVNSASGKIGNVSWTALHAADVATTYGGTTSLWSNSSATATAFTFTMAVGSFTSGGKIKVYGLRK